MTGSFISIDALAVDSVAKQLAKLMSNTDDLTSVFSEIGEHLLASTQDRMAQQISPDGEVWEALSPVTTLMKIKTGKSNKILRSDGTLADTLSYQIGNNQLFVGSNLEYGATHQFGRENIPARPYLGLSEDDNVEILDILNHYLSRF